MRGGTTAVTVNTRFYVKFKARAVAEILRQTGNHTDQLDILPFPGRRQFIGQPNFGTPAGKTEAKQKAAKQGQDFYARLGQRQDGQQTSAPSISHGPTTAKPVATARTGYQQRKREYSDACCNNSQPCAGYLKKYLPDHQSIHNNPWLRPFASSTTAPAFMAPESPLGGGRRCRRDVLRADSGAAANDRCGTLRLGFSG